MEERLYKIPRALEGLSPTLLKRMRRDEQIEFMRAWFHEHYDPPEENTPHDSEDGYIWIWGGPYEPREVLEEEFSGVVRPKLIEELDALEPSDCPSIERVASETRQPRS